MPETPSLRQFTLYFLRLGAVGFGGPIALAGYMQRDLVEDRRWVSPEDYKEGLALAQLAPGPLAAHWRSILDGCAREFSVQLSSLWRSYCLPS
jgi:chromate transport protein ChrA